jgi:Nod factor-specific ABC transporter NodJ protein
MWRREFAYWMLHYRRTWRTTVIYNIANPLLFFIGIGIGLGRLIDRNGFSGLHGMSYLAFLAPGLLAATAMLTGADESGPAAYLSLRLRRNYRAAAVTPMRSADILDGHLAFIAFRIASSAAVVLILMLCFGFSRSPLVLLSLPAALLTGLAFAAPLMAVGVLATSQRIMMTTFRFAVMPIYLFSGTFVAVGQLPAAIRPLVYVLPLWHGVELCRSLSTGHVQWQSAALHLLYLTALLLGGYAFARAAYRRALRM